MKRLGLLCILAACGGRTVGDDEPSRPPPLDVADDDGDIPCVECNGVCVDLENDDDNCGACGHVCKAPETFGSCEEGSCPAALWCSPGPVETCDDVCDSFGQRCIDGEPQDRTICAGENVFHESNGNALDECERGDGHSYRYPGRCSESIDWTIVHDTGPYSEAVACCCTQEPT